MSKQHTTCNPFILGMIFALGASLTAAHLAGAAVMTQDPELQPIATAAAPVSLGGRDLFALTAPLGTLSASQRATAIEQRLSSLADSAPAALATLRLGEADGYTGIFADTALIRAVTDNDAAHTGRTRRQLAADQLVIIRQALATEYRDRSTAHILRGALYSALATVALVALLLGLMWTRRRIRARVSEVAQVWRWKSGLAHLRLLSPSGVANMVRSFTAGLAWLVAVLLVYAYLEFVLSLFPWTRGFAGQMVAAAEHAVVTAFSGLFAYLPSLLNVIVIVVIARYILKGLKALFEQISLGRITIPGFFPDWGQPTYSLVRFLVITIAGIMVFPYLPGAGSDGFKGVSVFVGLLVSLGAASSVANIMAGVIITYMRPFQLGDRVKIADAVGDVTGKNLLVVRLKTIKNVDITLPNALVLANHIINFSANAVGDGLILHTTVTIGYDAPWKLVHALLIKAASKVEAIEREPAPFVMQTSLDDSYVTYQLNAYTRRPREMATLHSRLHEEIQNTFSEGGVEILSPHYAAVRDGNRKAVPEEYLPKDYRAPSFDIVSRILRPQRGP